MIQNAQKHDQNLIKIRSFFSNQDLIKLLHSQVSELEEFKQQFISTINVQSMHLFIYFHRLTTSKAENQNETDLAHEEAQYAIKITKTFPLSGLRVHIMNNNFLPRLLDCRDISQQILGQPWSYKNSLRDFFKKIGSFQAKLKIRNSHFLPMQMTGQFRIGDLFDIHQLKKFKALHVFQDKTTQQSPLLGLTQTHFLTFKQIPNTHKNKQKTYQLYRACELQCISQIFHCKASSQIIVSFTIYNIKKQATKICKKYKLENETQIFLKHLFKHIWNFQQTQINLALSSSNKSNQNEKIKRILEDSKYLQQKFEKTYEIKGKKQMKQQLIKCYHKLIQHFSECANSYYLIFVAKLDQLNKIALQDK